jgi:hypothetical protein
MTDSNTSGTRAVKARENRLRRKAERQRARLHKSGRRDPHAWDYGRWWIELDDGSVLWDYEMGGMARLTLDQAEAWLYRETDSGAAARGLAFRRAA